MRSRGVEGLLLVGALVVIACSGGPDQGPIAGPGPGPDEPGEGLERGDNPFNIPSTQSSATGEPTATVGTGSCTTCADFLNGNIGNGESCPGSQDAILNMVACACDGAVLCDADCMNNFCSGTGADAACTSCLFTECDVAYRDCQEN